MYKTHNNILMLNYLMAVEFVRPEMLPLLQVLPFRVLCQLVGLDHYQGMLTPRAEAPTP